MSNVNLSAGLKSSVASLLGLHVGLAEVCLLSVSSHGIFSVHVHPLCHFVALNFFLFIDNSQVKYFCSWTLIIKITLYYLRAGI